METIISGGGLEQSNPSLCKRRTVVVLPVNTSCNLDCTYCYHEEQKKKIRIIPFEILARMYNEISKYAENVTFLWHGGEPLLAGVDFFKQAIELQKTTKFVGRVTNNIQSNGTLINEEFSDFIVKSNVIFGVSIDGPKEIHDKNRKSFDGSGSFDRVMAGIKMLRDKGMNRIGSIALVTKDNVDYPDDVYNFLRTCGVTSSVFHFCSETEGGTSSLIPNLDKAIKFFQRVFDLWFLDDDSSFAIRNFVNVIRVLCGGIPIECASLHEGCRQLITINNLGDIYLCHRLVRNHEFKMGNIMEKSLSEIIAESEKLYIEASNIPEECFSCKWFSTCGGGCAQERLITNGRFNSKHPECELKKALFSHIEQKVKQCI